MAAVKTFVPGVPTIIDISAHRHLNSKTAPRGQVLTKVDTTTSLSEDRKLVAFSMTVTVEGKTDDGETAFTAACTVECDFTFTCELNASDLDDEAFVLHCSGPLYQRASLQLQDVAWRMGYTAVRVPLYYHHGDNERPQPVEEQKKARKTRKASGGSRKNQAPEESQD